MGIHNENPTWQTKNHDTLSLLHMSFAKVSLMGEDQSLSHCLTLGAEGENDATHRHVIADLIRNPEGRRMCGATTIQTNQLNPPLP